MTTPDPQPYRLLVPPKVTRQLEAILDYIAHDSPENASQFIATILAEIDGLRMFPSRQVVLPQSPASNPLRSLPIQNYMVFFTIIPKQRTVRIVRIVHGARRRSKRYG